tara:strand:+ start:380 stop:1078 length:699 start_codon:yes stop_codon:yes gene_type:complete
MIKKVYIAFFTVFWVSNVFAEEIYSHNRDLLKILHADSHWNIIEKTSDSIYISEKIIEGSGLNAVKVEKIYDIKPDYFTDVIMNVDAYSSFLSNAKSLYSKVIDNTPDGLIGYQRITVDLPFFDDREYYFYMSRKPFDNHSSNIMCYWILLEPGQSPTTNDLTENATYLKNGAGLWKWEPAQSGRIRISYILTMNPGGSIPYFLVGMINKNSIVGLFRDVQNEVMSKNYFES